MHEIISFFNEHGFQINHLTLDGRVHRDNFDSDDHKKSGWYIGFQNHTNSGEIFYVAVFGDWRTGNQFKYQSDVKLTNVDKSRVKKQIEDAKARSEAERKVVHEEVALDVAAVWKASVDAESHEYLKEKGIEPYGARLLGNSLLVPMRDADGKLWSLQKITPDGKKFFHPGGKVSECFFTIEGKGERVYVSEGFATAATVHAATGATSIAAFTAGNLLAVAKAAGKKYSAKMIVLCGDDDQFKPDKGNAGREKAEEAGKKTLSRVVFPKFASLETKPTDFNDLARLEGIGRVKEQLEGVKAERNYVMPLGYLDDKYYFTSTENQQIVEMTSFSDVQFLNLMRKEYWEALYPSKTGISWTDAKSDMMAQARRKGVFEPLKIRGSGVWVDDGRIVVNMGNRLLVDGVEMRVNEIESEFFYTIGKSLPELSGTPLTLLECEFLIELVDKFKWIDPRQSKFVAGLLVVSKVCGGLPVRPHAWFTGGSQTGKSTLLERLVFPTLKGYSNYFLGGTTEAGLRATARNDARPVIFDEFEINGTQRDSTVMACIELMRTAWGDSGGYIVKGSGTGAVNAYAPKFSAIVSSIRVGLSNDADKSRFSVFELSPHGDDKGHWEILDAMLHKYDQEYIDRLFLRTLKMMPILLENYKRISSALTVGTRYSQQYGMLLAGFSILVSDDVLCDEEVQVLVKHFGVEADLETTPDHEACLSRLLDSVISVDTERGRQNFSIGDLVDLGRANDPKEFVQNALHLLGIRAYSNGLFVSASGPELEKIFRDTRWAKGWGRSLARIPGAEKNVPMRFGGLKIRKGTKIPYESISR